MKVIIERLPETLEEFKEMKEMDLTKAENTCLMFLCALNLFVKDRDTGVAAINILKGPVELNSHEINFLKDRFMDKSYLPLAYFAGARPDNNYTPDQPYTLNLYDDPRPQDTEEGYFRLYLETAGADSKRAIKMRKKDDNWYIWEYPAIVMDIRKPKKDDPWA